MVKEFFVLFLFLFFFGSAFSTVIEGLDNAVQEQEGCNRYDYRCINAETGEELLSCSPNDIGDANFDLVYSISGNCTATRETLSAKDYKNSTEGLNKVILEITGVLNHKQGEDLIFDESIDEIWLDSGEIYGRKPDETTAGKSIVFGSSVAVKGPAKIQTTGPNGGNGDSYGFGGDHAGGNGSNGYAAGEIHFLKTVWIEDSTDLEVKSIGGNGGQGGNGSSESGCCRCRGEPGNGGNGGHAGASGAISFEKIVLKGEASSLDVVSQGGRGGNGGWGGTGACGGNSGDRLRGGSGGNGGNAGEISVLEIVNSTANYSLKSKGGSGGRRRESYSNNSNGATGKSGDVLVLSITPFGEGEGFAPKTIQANNLVLSTAWSDELESFGDLGFAGFSEWAVSETVSIMACWAKGGEVQLVEAKALDLNVADPFGFLEFFSYTGFTPLTSLPLNNACFKSVESEFRLPFFGLIKDKGGVPVNGRAKLRVFSLLGKEKTKENKVKWVKVKNGLINKKFNVDLFVNQFYLMRVDIEANGKTSSFSFPFFTWSFPK